MQNDAGQKLDRLTVASFSRPVSSEEINADIRREQARRAKQGRRGQERFTAIDAGFPRLLWLVWDHRAKDTVFFPKRRFQHFTTLPSALRVCDRLELASPSPDRST